MMKEPMVLSSSLKQTPLDAKDALHIDPLLNRATPNGLRAIKTNRAEVMLLPATLAFYC